MNRHCYNHSHYHNYTPAQLFLAVLSNHLYTVYCTFLHDTSIAQWFTGGTCFPCNDTLKVFMASQYLSHFRTFIPKVSTPLCCKTNFIPLGIPLSLTNFWTFSHQTPYPSWQVAFHQDPHLFFTLRESWRIIKININRACSSGYLLSMALFTCIKNLLSESLITNMLKPNHTYRLINGNNPDLH